MDDDAGWYQQQLEERQQFEAHQQLIALFFILISMEVCDETI